MSKNDFNLYGFNKSSEAGTDKFAFSVFIKGCNLRCPYCMNCNLVKGNPPPIKIEDIDAAIEQNKPKMVIISGGEPTNMETSQLFKIIAYFRNKSCRVGISTNGTNPQKLEVILPYLSYVAMDLKSNADGYRSLGEDDLFFKVIHTWSILRNRIKNNGIIPIPFDYEIRTTLYPRLIPSYSVIAEMGHLFNKNEKWILQPFRITKYIMTKEAKKVIPYNNSLTELILRNAQTSTKATVELHYV